MTIKDVNLQAPMGEGPDLKGLEECNRVRLSQLTTMFHNKDK